MVDPALQEMTPRGARLHAQEGRTSIAPERLLRALRLQIFYSVRSERLLMEQLHYNLLFRWFVGGMERDEAVWNHAVFSKNRARLLNEEIATAFFQRVLKIAQPYLSDEHFTVEGPRIEAWTSHKSFRPKQEPPRPGSGTREVDFHGETRSNDTHQSTTDPHARLDKKSKGSEAKLSYGGQGLRENRHGRWVKTLVRPADGPAEREAALRMAATIAGLKRVTRGAAKNYDPRDFVRALRQMNVTPHVAQNTTNRSSALDERTMRHAGYVLSQQKRNAWKRAWAG